MLSGSCIYGAVIPDTFFSTTKPSFSTNATTSSSVSSTLPGSAIPVNDTVSKSCKLNLLRTYLCPGLAKNPLHDYVPLGHYSQSAIEEVPR